MGNSLEPVGRAYHRLFDHRTAIVWAVLALGLLVEPLDVTTNPEPEPPATPVGTALTLFLVAVWVALFVVADGWLLWSLADWEGTFRSRIPGLAGWGVLGATVSGTFMTGAYLVGRSVVGVGAAAWTAVVVLCCWPAATLYVSPAILDGRSLREALVANGRAVRDAPLATAAAGGVVSVAHGFVTLGLVVSFALIFFGIALAWLIVPLILVPVGVVVGVPALLVSPVVYAYTRAIKVEAYEAATDTDQGPTTA